MALTLIIYFFSFTAFLLIALFVLSRNKRNQANILFSTGMFFHALAEFSRFYFELKENNSTVLLSRITTATDVIALFAWLLFSLTFTYQHISKQLQKSALSISVTAAFSTIFLYLLLAYDKFFIYDELGVVLGFTGKLYMGFTIVVSAIILMNLERLLQKAGKPFKRRLLVFMAGVGTILLAYILKGSMGLLYSALFTSSDRIFAILFILGNCLIGYSIVRHKLLDTDIFFSRYVVYRSFSMFAIGAYLLMTGIISGWISNIGSNLVVNMLFLFAASIALAFVINSPLLRYRIKLFINKNFFKYKHDFRDTWLEVVETVPRLKTADAVVIKVVALIRFHLKAKNIYFWLYRNDGFVGPDGKTKIPLSQDAVTLLLAQNKVMNLSKSWKVTLRPEEKELFCNLGEDMQLLIPVRLDETIIGIVTIGKNILGDDYSPDDMDLAWAVIRQGAAMIVNLNLTEKLLESKEVEIFSSFSSFVIHDLKNFTQTLSLMMQNASCNMDNPEFIQDSFKHIGIIVGKMEKITTNLSSISGRLNLDIERVDANAWLKQYSEMMNTMFPGLSLAFIDLNLVCYVMIDTTHFEKVVHNFILNAIESKPNERITMMISLKRIEKQVAISFTDNGAGISADFIANDMFKPFKTTKPKGLGIGLFECKKIVEAFEGKIEVKSCLGEGTTIIVTLPATPADPGDIAANKQETGGVGEERPVDN